MGKRLELPPGLRIRRGRFHYRFQIDGITYSGATGLAATARNLTSALSKLAAARKAAAAGEEPSRLRVMPFSEAARLFLDWAGGEYERSSTVRRLSVSFASLTSYFDGVQVHRLTSGSIEDYKAWRRSTGIREVTLRHDLHALSLFVQYARKQHWIRTNPLDGVAIPSDRAATRQHVLSPAEELAYLTTADWMRPHLADAARLMLLTGMRPDEVARIRCADVDLAAGTLTVRTGKSNAAARTLALVPNALKIVRRRMSGQWLFPSPRRATHIARFNGAHDAVLRHWNQAHPDRPLHFCLYDLRHTFATRMAESGCPPATLAAILGHCDLRTLHRYVHASREAQHEAMLRYGAAQREQEEARA